MNHKLLFITFLILTLSSGLVLAQETREKQETDYYAHEERVIDTKELKEIRKDRKVKVNYTLKADGKETGQAKGLQHARYTHGKNEMPPWLESKLEGLKEGEQKTITIPPEEAYGDVIQEGFKEWSKADLPEGAKIEQGTSVDIVLPEGLLMPAIIEEVRKDTVVLNFNHPLAGKTLTYEVDVVDVQ